jgi:hypothetical protein
VEFARWLEERKDRLADRWITEVRARGTIGNGVQGDLLERFFQLLVSTLPAFLGPYRTQVEGIWLQISELFGQVSALRGLAAGEVIEEFQILREVLIRMLYAEPPASGGARLSLRDMLSVNKVIDRGVTQSSVGHTDALFFSLFGGSGVPEALDAERIAEVRQQLDALEAEFRDIMRTLQE